jgi:two-component system sensor histidine kinase UhpB
MRIRIAQMWERLSLRARLFLPLGAMFVVALILGSISLHFFTTTQLIEENEPATRSAKLIADALNMALRTSANPQQTLEAFGQTLGTSEAIQFRPAGTGLPVHPPLEVRTPFGKVPAWFVSLLTVPEIGGSFPVTIDGRHIGNIVFSPDLSADLFEKWIGFLAIAFAGTGLIVLTAAIAYFTTGAALGPLQQLGEGLTRMRTGDYEHLIPVSGPPEIRKSGEEANELARTLDRLSRDNRGLLRQIVSLQDDERRDLARELHDELGPVLFGIRANAVALLEALPPGSAESAWSAQGMIQSVEALQQANRRILDRLRPLYIQELGLERSIETLLQNARSQAPDLRLTSSIDHRLAGLDGILSQTVYRVIQEGVTNVLRHARASSMNIEAAIERGDLVIEISDDGSGIPEDNLFGRGLTGMHERVRALSGTFSSSARMGGPAFAAGCQLECHERTEPGAKIAGGRLHCIFFPLTTADPIEFFFRSA